MFLNVKVEHDFEHEQERTLREYFGFFEDDAFTIGYNFTGKTLACVLRKGPRLSSEKITDASIEWVAPGKTSGQFYIVVAKDIVLPIGYIYYDVMSTEDASEEAETIAYGKINLSGSETPHG